MLRGREVDVERRWNLENGNGKGKMGMENGAGGERTEIAGWFMVLDFRGGAGSLRGVKDG